MARVGLDNMEKRTATHAAFADMFKPSTEKEAAEPAESTAATTETNAAKKKRKIKTKQKTRQTYYMDPILIEALRQMSFETREGVSDLVNDLIRSGIPDNYLNKAAEVVEGAKESEEEE